MKYKTIIFDFGGVILNIDFALTHKAFLELGVKDLDIKFSQTQQSGFFDQFEKGQIKPEQFRKEIKKHLSSKITDKELDTAWNKMLLDIPKERINWVLKLKEQYQCVLLSNTNKIHYDHYRANLEREYGYKIFSELFDKTYFSHEMGLRKPDANIYKYVLNDLNLKASEVLFIDDTQQNIDTSRAHGWNSILWKKHELNELVGLTKKTWFDLKQEFISNLLFIYEQRESEQIFFLILQDVFSISKIDYSLNKQNKSTEEQIKQLSNIALELKTNKPIQQILGYGYFFERKFKVSKDVLIPRQETEELVDIILKEHKNKNSNILDIGTGTGCIGISLKLENPNFNVGLIDISEKSLNIATENSDLLNSDVKIYKSFNILSNAEWHRIDNKSIDIIVSNPPYIRQSEKKQIHNNVKDFDPELALFVDDNKPLVFYESISKFASQKLLNGGCLYFEINEAFGKEVIDVLIKYNFINVKIVKDLQGKDRFVLGQK